MRSRVRGKYPLLLVLEHGHTALAVLVGVHAAGPAPTVVLLFVIVLPVASPSGIRSQSQLILFPFTTVVVLLLFCVLKCSRHIRSKGELRIFRLLGDMLHLVHLLEYDGLYSLLRGSWQLMHCLLHKVILHLLQVLLLLPQ